MDQSSEVAVCLTFHRPLNQLLFCIVWPGNLLSNKLTTDHFVSCFLLAFAGITLGDEMSSLL